MESSFWFDALKLGKSLVHIKGCQVIIFNKYCFYRLKLFFTFTNSVDPDEMQHNAAFYLGFHFLKKYSLGVSPFTNC